MNCKELFLRDDFAHLDRTIEVRLSDLDPFGHLALSRLCGHLQDAAGDHATRLGCGLNEIIPQKRTWMMSRLTLDLLKPLGINDTLLLRTWPSGVRRGLVAMRDFVGLDSAGEPVFAAASEWLFIDTERLRITRLPESLLALMNDAIPHVALSDDTPTPAIAADWTPAVATNLFTRHSDLDINHHANNTRYSDWFLEPLAPEFVAAHRLSHIDITFKTGASFRETVESAVSAPAADTPITHRLRRIADNATLAVATSRWAALA